MTGTGNIAQAGGAILALSIIAGTVGGVIAGESSIGFLAGIAAGALLLAWFWLRERRR